MVSFHPGKKLLKIVRYLPCYSMKIDKYMDHMNSKDETPAKGKCLLLLKVPQRIFIQCSRLPKKEKASRLSFFHRPPVLFSVFSFWVSLLSFFLATVWRLKQRSTFLETLNTIPHVVYIASIILFVWKWPLIIDSKYLLSRIQIRSLSASEMFTTSMNYHVEIRSGETEMESSAAT